MLTGAYYTNDDLKKSFQNLQGKTLQDLFPEDELKRLQEKYWISFQFGYLSIGPKDIYISTRNQNERQG